MFSDLSIYPSMTPVTQLSQHFAQDTPPDPSQYDMLTYPSQYDMLVHI